MVLVVREGRGLLRLGAVHGVYLGGIELEVVIGVGLLTGV